MREGLRHAIFGILLLITMAIIGSYPARVLFVSRTQEKLVVDGSLATILLFGLIAAVLCASHTIAREIETGTVLLVLSKPVGRVSFIVAKVLGILAAITLFVWSTSMCTLIALKSATDQFRFDPYLMGGVFAAIGVSCLIGAGRNYFAKRSFPAACATSLCVTITLVATVAMFLPRWEQNRYLWARGSSYFDPNLCRGLILILFAVWAMATMATALSTRFNMMSNLTICLVIFVVGLMSDWFHGNIINTKLADLERMMLSWYFIFVPLVLLLWVVTIKHFHQRRNLKLRVWEIHLVFAMLVGGFISKAVADHINQVHLQEPAPWMKAAARGIYEMKNGVADAVYAAIPNWQQFWLADALAKGSIIPGTYLLMGALYVFLFMFMFTLLAVAMFADREVGKQMIG
ncbi:hypothetical protein BVY04_05375 [bacterium M21]|nr:hypothetical protein BVY04_05375 [bacterium M21]